MVRALKFRQIFLKEIFSVKKPYDWGKVSKSEILVENNRSLNFGSLIPIFHLFVTVLLYQKVLQYNFNIVPYPNVSWWRKVLQPETKWMVCWAGSKNWLNMCIPFFLPFYHRFRFVFCSFLRFQWKKKKLHSNEQF